MKFSGYLGTRNHPNERRKSIHVQIRRLRVWNSLIRTGDRAAAVFHNQQQRPGFPSASCLLLFFINCHAVYRIN